MAYGQIPRAQRAELHRRVALWIEALGRAEDMAELRAHHWLNAAAYARQAGIEAHDLERHARTALVEAADRARSLNALEAAERFYDQALALWPDEGLDRDLLAIRRVVVGVLQSTPIDRAETTALSERLVAAGHPAEAAVAEMALSVAALDANDRELSSVFEQRSLELLEDLPPSRETAFVLSYVARSRIAHVRFEEAIEVAQRAREVAEALGDREGVIAALTTIGTCTASVGGDLTMLEDAIERAAAVRSPEYTRGLTNLASILVDRGELDRGVDAQERALDDRERVGSPWGTMWSRAELGYTRHLQGRWDEALVFVEAVIRYVEGGTAHYIAPLALTVRASIRVARDDVAGALEDSARAAELALRTDDQMVPGALGPRLGVLLHAGLHDEARTTAEELFARHPSATLLWESRAWAALEELGMLERLVAAGAPRGPSHWYEAGSAYAEGRYLDAADELAAIGARTDEALARLRGARALIAGGHANEGEAQLERALAFWRSVGAVRHVRDAEALLQTA